MLNVGLNPPCDYGPLRLHSSQEGAKFLLMLIADLAQKYNIVPQQLDITRHALPGSPLAQTQTQTAWRFQRQSQIADLWWISDGPIRMDFLLINPLGHIDSFGGRNGHDDPVLWWAPPKTNGAKLGYHRARLFKHLGKQTGEPMVTRLGIHR
jgi:hypothetical protein